MKKLLIAAVWSIFFFSFSAAVFAKPASLELPAGVTALNDFRYPVYLYTPESSAKVEGRTLLLVIYGGIEPLEKSIEAWSPVGAERQWLVASAELKLREEDVPFKFDEWVLNLKNTLVLQKNVSKVYLVGGSHSARYVAYLGLKYPKEFTAVAVTGGSWISFFEKLTNLSSNANEQAPFFVALEAADAHFKAAQEKAEVMKAKGYSVQFVTLDKEDEDTSAAFRNKMMDWCVEASDARLEKAEKAEKGHKTFKEKVSTAVDEFFAV